MDTVALTLGLCWAVDGGLILVLSIPLVQGRIPRNRFYGVRLPTAMKDDEAWYTINRFGGKRLIAASVPLILVGIISLFLPLSHHLGLTLICGLTPLAILSIPIVQILLFAQEYKEHHGQN